MTLNIIQPQKLLMFTRIKKHLHRVHLWTDAGIGAIALVTVVLGDKFFAFFVNADLVFHCVIFTMAFGGIIAERFLHKHEGVIGN